MTSSQDQKPSQRHAWWLGQREIPAGAPAEGRRRVPRDPSLHTAKRYPASTLAASGLPSSGCRVMYRPVITLAFGVVLPRGHRASAVSVTAAAGVSRNGGSRLRRWADARVSRDGGSRLRRWADADHGASAVSNRAAANPAPSRAAPCRILRPLGDMCCARGRERRLIVEEIFIAEDFHAHSMKKFRVE